MIFAYLLEEMLYILQKQTIYAPEDPKASQRDPKGRPKGAKGKPKDGMREAKAPEREKNVAKGIPKGGKGNYPSVTPARKCATPGALSSRSSTWEFEWVRGPQKEDVPPTTSIVSFSGLQTSLLQLQPGIFCLRFLAYDSSVGFLALGVYLWMLSFGYLASNLELWIFSLLSLALDL